MDCTICGKATLPGAMLCAPCKAALKRARYVTVQEDMRRPSVIDPRRPPRRARPPIPAPTPDSGPALPVPMPEARDAISHLGRRIFIGIFVFAAALGGASYFGQRELGARSQDETAALPAPTPTPAPDVRVEMAASVAVPRNDDAIVASPPVASSTVAPAGADLASQTQPATKPTAIVPMKRTLLASRASFATANGDPPEALNAPPEPEKPAPEPAPPPAPAPDRWQNMRDALAQCDREGMFNGIICGQRVRIQYCESYWGKVAQCPGPAANPER